MVAKLLGASLRLHAVVHDPSANFDLFHIADDAHVRHTLCDQAQQVLEQQAAQLSTDLGQPAAASVEWAHPFDRGVMRAIEVDWPDLVFICARDVNRLSAAEWRLIHRCEIPVWLVRDQPWPAAPKTAAFIDPAHRYNLRSRANGEVISWALAASAGPQSVTVMHAMADPADATGGAQDWKRLADQRRKELMAIISEQTDQELAVELAAVEPAALMRDFASGSGAALAVLGVFSRSRLGDLLIGSSAREVLPTLDCDVLAVPADR